MPSNGKTFFVRKAWLLNININIFNSYVSVSIADGAPKRIDGKMSASTAPGLGITPKMNVLGKPVLEVS